ncbi:MAG: ACT domain-containing protein, partial [Alphaproteobacteria bacterium]
ALGTGFRAGVFWRDLGVVNSLRITNRAEDWCEVLVDVEVRDISHLTEVLAARRACPGITQVERGKGSGSA